MNKYKTILVSKFGYVEENTWFGLATSMRSIEVNSKSGLFISGQLVEIATGKVLKEF